MRAASRLLAAVRSAKYLEPGTPTGLTGLPTIASPRPALINVYTSTLEELKKIPESSIYRQSVEALTRHRLAIVESQIPDGYDAWRTRMDKKLIENPTLLEKYSRAIKRLPDGRPLVLDLGEAVEKDERDVEWDGEEQVDVDNVTHRSPKYLEAIMSQETEEQVEADSGIQIEPEPPLTKDQISEIETQVGSGLIEEIIRIADSEKELLSQMIEAKPWEELVEKAAEGQWSYFERATHTSTQKPAN